MPVLSYQVNAPGYGGINPKVVYIFTNDPVATVTQTGYIDWLANQQGIYTGDVALVVTRQTPTSTLGADFYEFVRVGSGPHWNLVPQTFDAVDSVTGTLNQIIASPTTGDVIVSIDPDPQLPGTGSVGLPKGTTAQQAGIVGSIRFNTQTSVFEGTIDGSTWVPFSTGSGNVLSLTGTANQIVVSSPTGNVTISIDPDPILPGSAAVTLPTGNTAARGNIAGSIRFNSQISAIELTNNGTNWYVVSTGNDTVNSVSGTANRITVTGTNNVVVDIAATYVGQTSITTLGTIVTGTWNADTITVPYGGTGKTSFTAYAPVCGGITTTAALASADSGISNVGYVLKSTGAASLPTWQAETAATGDGAKFWVTITNNGTTILESFNVSSVTDTAAGRVSVNFTVAFAAATWSGQVSTIDSSEHISVYETVSASSGALINRLSNSPFSAGDPAGSWFACGFGAQ